MRTTLTIDDDIARQLREIVHRSGKPFKNVVNEALRTGMENNRIADVSRPYRLEPVAMGEATVPTTSTRRCNSRIAWKTRRRAASSC